MVGKIVFGMLMAFIVVIGFSGTMTPVKDVEYTLLDDSRQFTLNKPIGQPTYIKFLKGWQDVRGN